MSLALPGGPSAPRAPLVGTNSSSSLTNHEPSENSRPHAFSRRLTTQRRDNIVRGQSTPLLKVSPIVLEKVAAANRDSNPPTLRMSTDSATEHGLNDLDVFWKDQAEAGVLLGRSGSLQSFVKARSARQPDGYLSDARNSTTGGSLTSRSDGDTSTMMHKRSRSDLSGILGFGTTRIGHTLSDSLVHERSEGESSNESENDDISHRLSTGNLSDSSESITAIGLVGQSLDVSQETGRLQAALPTSSSSHSPRQAEPSTALVNSPTLNNESSISHLTPTHAPPSPSPAAPKQDHSTSKPEQLHQASTLQWPSSSSSDHEGATLNSVSSFPTLVAPGPSSMTSLSPKRVERRNSHGSREDPGLDTPEITSSTSYSLPSLVTASVSSKSASNTRINADSDSPFVSSSSSVTATTSDSSAPISGPAATNNSSSGASASASASAPSSAVISRDTTSVRDTTTTTTTQAHTNGVSVSSAPQTPNSTPPNKHKKRPSSTTFSSSEGMPHPSSPRRSSVASSPSLPGVVGVSASTSTAPTISTSSSTLSPRNSSASSSHRASVHLSGLFDRNSSLDLHSPNPNPFIRADFSSFLRSAGSETSAFHHTDPATQTDSDIEYPVASVSHPQDPVIIAEEEDSEPLFDIEEWRRTSTADLLGSNSHTIPGLSFSRHLTLKELQELHGAEIEAFVAPPRRDDDSPDPQQQLPICQCSDDPGTSSLDISIHQSYGDGAEADASAEDDDNDSDSEEERLSRGAGRGSSRDGTGTTIGSNSGGRLEAAFVVSHHSTPTMPRHRRRTSSTSSAETSAKWSTSHSDHLLNKSAVVGSSHASQHICEHCGRRAVQYHHHHHHHHGTAHSSSSSSLHHHHHHSHYSTQQQQPHQSHQPQYGHNARTSPKRPRRVSNPDPFEDTDLDQWGDSVSLPPMRGSHAMVGSDSAQSLRSSASSGGAKHPISPVRPRTGTQTSTGTGSSIGGSTTLRLSTLLGSPSSGLASPEESPHFHNASSTSPKSILLPIPTVQIKDIVSLEDETHSPSSMKSNGSTQTATRTLLSPRSNDTSDSGGEDSSSDDASPFVQLGRERKLRRKRSQSKTSQGNTHSASQGGHHYHHHHRNLFHPSHLMDEPQHVPLSSRLSPRPPVDSSDIAGVMSMLSGGPREGKDLSKHRRNPSQTKMERRLREIERRLDMLERYQASNPSSPGLMDGYTSLRTSIVYGPAPGYAVPSTSGMTNGAASPFVDRASASVSSPYSEAPAVSSSLPTTSSLNASSVMNASSGGWHTSNGSSAVGAPAASHFTPGIHRRLRTSSHPVSPFGTNTNSNSASASYAGLGASSATSIGPSTNAYTTMAPYQTPSATPIASTKQATAATYSPNDHAYNRRFQEIMQLSGPIKYIQMAALGRDFVQLAEVYGRIIISERCLPPEQKSIKPVALGGQAGGSKFMVQGILFKYALDVKLSASSGKEKWLYGGKRRDDGAAMKAASNELLGLSAFIKCNSSNAIRFPLMSLIDYCGYRLVAVSTLPINSETIVYGSADAGRSVHNKDEFVMQAMQEFGHDLNLREHMVFNTAIMGPGDLEVHKGLDGFRYMIDFARTFPPEAPGEHPNPQCIFYKLLRPELVRTNSRPLSSDAFSGWQSTDSQSEAMNADVSDATKRLHEAVIPSYPQQNFLNPDFQAHFRSEVCNISDLHRRGINLRHLGRVRAEMFKVVEDNDSLYLVEMICRTLKSYISMRFRSLMDDLIIFAEEPFRNEALLLFNLVAQPSAASDFWHVRVKQLIQRKYGSLALRPEEMDPSVMLLNQVRKEHRLYLVRRLAWHLSVIFDDNIWDNFQEALNADAEFEFFPQDIKEIKPRIKYMTILDLALGITLYMQAAGAVDASRNEANLLLLQEAKICLVNGWTRISDCLVTRYFLGKVWYLMGKLKTDGADDFARALVMIESTMVEERDRPDLRLDYAKAGVMAFIHGREPKRFETALIHYREVAKTHESLALTLRNDVLAWVSNQHANKGVDNSTFESRIRSTKSVMKHLITGLTTFEVFCSELETIASAPRICQAPLSRSTLLSHELAGRLFTS